MIYMDQDQELENLLHEIVSSDISLTSSPPSSSLIAESLTLDLQSQKSKINNSSRSSSSSNSSNIYLLAMEEEITKFKLPSKSSNFRKIHYLNSLSAISTSFPVSREEEHEKEYDGYENQSHHHDHHDHHDDHHKRRKKRKKKMTLVRIPRIINRDIRRKYVEMWGNVFNSHDYHFIYSFLKEFGTKNISLRKKFYIVSEKNYNPIAQAIRFDGAEPLATYFFANHLLSPDSICSISNSQIKNFAKSPVSASSSSYSDGSSDRVDSILLSKVFTAGTRLYDANPFEVMNVMEEIKKKYHLSSSEAVISHPEFISYQQNLKLLVKPNPYSFHALGTYEINEHKQISQMKLCIFLSDGFGSL